MAYLDVNQAAIDQYGYSREEFLSMTIRDIRPAAEVAKVEAFVAANGKSALLVMPGVFTHIKKDGTEIKVEIVSSALMYNGRPARLALAVDVTERNRHLTAIEEQNKRLRAISWMQSHIIRAPLSRLMGLVNLLNETQQDADTQIQILAFIDQSAKELDDVVKDIIKNADSDKPLDNSAGEAVIS